MSRLFRLSDTKKRDPAVEAWFGKHPEALGRLARHWFEEIRAAGPEVREVLHDGCPTACVADAAFAYVAVFTGHVNLGFFRGAELPDPAGLLEGTGRFMRHVKLRPARAIDIPAWKRLVATAYTDMLVRVEADTRARPNG